MSFSDSNEIFYEVLERAAEAVSEKPKGDWTCFIRLYLALLVRAGFVLVQLGSIPSENVFAILSHNVLDVSICILSFTFVGFMFAYGDRSLGGVLAYGQWIGSNDVNFEHATHGVAEALVGTGIITSMLAGRVHPATYMLLTVLYSGFLQPITLYSVWNDKGLLSSKVTIGGIRVVVKDYAGSIVTQLTAGTIAFVGSCFLGRRLIRLEEISQVSIGPWSPGNVLIGYVLVATGLMGTSLYLPSEVDLGRVSINNLVALSTALIATYLIHWIVYGSPVSYWVFLRCLQGGIAGLVTISAGADIYHPIAVFFVALVESLLFHAISIVIELSYLEDNCNIIATHFFSALFGSTLPPIVAMIDNLGLSVMVRTRAIHFSWQLICVLVIAVISAVLAVIVFGSMLLCGLLRSRGETQSHQRAVIARTNIPERSWFQTLFPALPGETPEYVDPGPTKQNFLKWL